MLEHLAAPSSTIGVFVYSVPTGVCPHVVRVKFVQDPVPLFFQYQVHQRVSTNASGFLCFERRISLTDAELLLSLIASTAETSPLDLSPDFIISTPKRRLELIALLGRN